MPGFAAAEASACVVRHCLHRSLGCRPAFSAGLCASEPRCRCAATAQRTSNTEARVRQRTDTCFGCADDSSEHLASARLLFVDCGGHSRHQPDFCHAVVAHHPALPRRQPTPMHGARGRRRCQLLSGGRGRPRRGAGHATTRPASPAQRGGRLGLTLAGAAAALAAGAPPIWPGGGAPSAVKADFCSASVSGSGAGGTTTLGLFFMRHSIRSEAQCHGGSTASLCAAPRNRPQTEIRPSRFGRNGNPPPGQPRPACAAPGIKDLATPPRDNPHWHGVCIG